MAEGEHRGAPGAEQFTAPKEARPLSAEGLRYQLERLQTRIEAALASHRVALPSDRKYLDKLLSETKANISDLTMAQGNDLEKLRTILNRSLPSAIKLIKQYEVDEAAMDDTGLGDYDETKLGTPPKPVELMEDKHDSSVKIVIPEVEFNDHSQDVLDELADKATDLEKFLRYPAMDKLPQDHPHKTALRGQADKLKSLQAEVSRTDLSPEARIKLHAQAIAAIEQADGLLDEIRGQGEVKTEAPTPAGKGRRERRGKKEAVQTFSDPDIALLALTKTLDLVDMYLAYPAIQEASKRGDQSALAIEKSLRTAGNELLDLQESLRGPALPPAELKNLLQTAYNKFKAAEALIARIKRGEAIKPPTPPSGEALPFTDKTTARQAVKAAYENLLNNSPVSMFVSKPVSEQVLQSRHEILEQLEHIGQELGREEDPEEIIALFRLADIKIREADEMLAKLTDTSPDNDTTEADVARMEGEGGGQVQGGETRKKANAAVRADMEQAMQAAEQAEREAGTGFVQTESKPESSTQAWEDIKNVQVKSAHKAGIGLLDSAPPDLEKWLDKETQAKRQEIIDSSIQLSVDISNVKEPQEAPELMRGFIRKVKEKTREAEEMGRLVSEKYKEHLAKAGEKGSKPTVPSIPDRDDDIERQMLDLMRQGDKPGPPPTAGSASILTEEDRRLIEEHLRQREQRQKGAPSRPEANSLANSPGVREIIDLYNQAVTNKDSQRQFRDAHHPVRFGPQNAEERRQDLGIPPDFKNDEAGDYWAVPVPGLENRYAVTPRVDLTLQEFNYNPGAMAEAFDIPGYDHKERYQGVRVVKPAIFEYDSASGQWKLIEKGKLNLKPEPEAKAPPAQGGGGSEKGPEEKLDVLRKAPLKEVQDFYKQCDALAAKAGKEQKAEVADIRGHIQKFEEALLGAMTAAHVDQVVKELRVEIEKSQGQIAAIEQALAGTGKEKTFLELVETTVPKTAPEQWKRCFAAYFKTKADDLRKDPAQMLEWWGKFEKACGRVGDWLRDGKLKDHLKPEHRAQPIADSKGNLYLIQAADTTGKWEFYQLDAAGQEFEIVSDKGRQEFTDKQAKAFLEY